jgi:hypothetical protein
MHKKIISAVLALTLTFGAAGLPAAESGIFTESGIAVSANAATYGDYEYELLDDGTVEISKYIGSDTTAKIPSKINGKAYKHNS